MITADLSRSGQQRARMGNGIQIQKGLTMTIRIEILTGHASPWSADLDKDEITIGRAADADVRLHPTKDTACSRELHARLVRDGDEWVLHPVHDTGITIVDVDGLEIAHHDSSEQITLNHELYFELGRGGPRLSVNPRISDMPYTDRRVHRGADALPVGRIPGQVIKRARQAPRVIAIIVASVVVLGAVLAIWINSIGSGAKHDVDELRSDLIQEAELTSGQMTAMNQVLSDLQARPTDIMGAVLRGAAESVWLVGVVNRDNGAFHGIGTAWVIDDTHLATNAHVAIALGEAIQANSQLSAVARQQAHQGPELVLSTEHVIHPGYERWRQILDQQFRRAVSGALETVDLISPCDVALLAIEEGSPGPALALATDLSRNALLGIPVGYVGFPMENVSGLPSMQMIDGRLTNLTDFFFQRARNQDASLLHYNADTVGGASGSPLLNDSGEVVGLVSAGSMISASGGRISVGINYAQRVDLLAELLTGTAEANQAQRDRAWRDSMKMILATPEEIVDQLIEIRLESTQFERIDDRIVSLVQSGVDQGQSYRFELEPRYAYAIAAVSRDCIDIDLGVIDGNTVVVVDEAINWFPIVLVEPSSSRRTVEVLIWASGEVDGTSEAVFRVARIRR